MKLCIPCAVSFKYSAKGPSEDITSMTIESVSGKPVRTDTTNQTTPQQMKYESMKTSHIRIVDVFEIDCTSMRKTKRKFRHANTT